MRWFLLSTLLSLAGPVAAQDSTVLAREEESEWDDAPAAMNVDSLIASFEWLNGTIQFQDGIASLNLAPSHKFLHYDQAYHLLVEVWNNPPGLTEDLLGVVVRSDGSVYDDQPAYLLYHEWSGYIPDEEAGSIDFDAKLKDMIVADSLNNIQRRELGYDGLQLLRWALPPHYDADRKALHWAKEMRSDQSDRNVLNYNVRLLGRHGIITVNAITTMDQLDEVRKELPEVLDMLSFNDGYRYEQFDPSKDSRSEKSLEGLIDGRERDRTPERLWFAAKVAVGGFVTLLLLLIGIWFLARRKR